jgi:hypothetical protein
LAKENLNYLWLALFSEIPTKKKENTRQSVKFIASALKETEPRAQLNGSVQVSKKEKDTKQGTLNY